MAQQVAFATGVPSNIYAFHRYTRNSTFPSYAQAKGFQRLAGVEPLSFTSDLLGRLRTLYAQ